MGMGVAQVFDQGQLAEAAMGLAQGSCRASLPAAPAALAKI